MNLLETYAQPLREEIEEKERTISTISREKAQLEEEKEAQKKEYEAIIKALKDELASKSDSDKELEI